MRQGRREGGGRINQGVVVAVFCQSLRTGGGLKYLCAAAAPTGVDAEPCGQGVQ